MDSALLETIVGTWAQNTYPEIQTTDITRRRVCAEIGRILSRNSGVLRELFGGDEQVGQIVLGILNTLSVDAFPEYVQTHVLAPLPERVRHSFQIALMTIINEAQIRKKNAQE